MAKLYSSYMFREKDPEIDELRTLIETNYGEKVRYNHLTKIERGGGPSASCMANWFFGKTKRPSNPTMEAAGRAMGFRRKWTKMSGEERDSIQRAVEKANRSKRG